MRTTLALAAAALALQFGAAHAQSVVALIGDDMLATFDAKTAKTTGKTQIQGLGPVLGIDMRPADGLLYALAADGTIATIDPATGAATPKSKLDTMPPSGVAVSVDFNPAADRLRIIGSDGTNLRANVDDGKVTTDKPLNFAATDASNGKTAMVVAAGYSNSVKGTKETTLYDIDGETGALVKQAPPNDGVLNTIGALGVDAASVAFDIQSDASGGNTGILLAKGSLYTVNLTTGKASGAKKIAGLPADVRDIAVLGGPAQKGAEVDMMGAEQTAGYLPPAAEGNPAAMPMQPAAMPMRPASLDLKGGDAKPAPRASAARREAYASAKPIKSARGPQCDERRAEY